MIFTIKSSSNVSSKLFNFLFSAWSLFGPEYREQNVTGHEIRIWKKRASKTLMADFRYSVYSILCNLRLVRISFGALYVIIAVLVRNLRE
jgi:hypothetical protein